MKVGIILILSFWVLSSCVGLDRAEPVSEAEPLIATGTLSIPAADSRITVMGRAQSLADNSLVFGFPAVTLSFSFQGDSLDLHAHSSQGNSYVEIIIDGQIQKIAIPKQPSIISLFRDTNIGVHNVELIHSSETWHGLVTLKSFDIGNGSILEESALSDRRIVFVGDSVTCGEAIDRPGSTSSCGTKVSRWWNPRLSYGMLIAKSLDAQAQLVCMGGRGLIRSWNGVTNEEQAPEFYSLAVVDGSNSSIWDQSTFTPDVVFISLGTNDFSSNAGAIPTEQQYVPKYVAFVKAILADHPQSTIILTEGALLGGNEKSTLIKYLHLVKAQVASQQVYVLPSNSYTGDGCDFHPTKEHHQKMAKDYVPEIKRIMAW